MMLGQNTLSSQGNLHVGGGLHYWNGVSRLSSNSTLNFYDNGMRLFFNWFNIEVTDQFARQFGVYAKGQIRKIGLSHIYQ